MSTSTTIGKYTIRQGLRHDNPQFPVYLVYVGEKLIGKQFSVPSLSDCQWLERQADPLDITYVRNERKWGRQAPLPVLNCQRCSAPFIPRRVDRDPKYCHACKVMATQRAA